VNVKDSKLTVQDTSGLPGVSGTVPARVRLPRAGGRAKRGPLTHLDEQGSARMVNVTDKMPTKRIALAGCEILMKPETLELLKSGQIKKGDAFTVSKIAGIMAAKKTHEMIPLCHPLPLEAIDICFQDDLSRSSVMIECRVETTAKTGVEMEALHGAMMAALTLYDMAKAQDPGMIISNLRLIQKTGGKSDYTA